MSSTRPAVTVQEFADAMTLSKSKVKAMIAAGEIRATKIGRRVIIPSSEIARLLERS